MALARHGSSRLRLAVAAGLLLAPAAHLATAEDLVVLRAGDSRRRAPEDGNHRGKVRSVPSQGRTVDHAAVSPLSKPSPKIQPTGAAQ